MTQVKTVTKGDMFICTHRRLEQPLLGTVLVITTEPGKMIGMQFEKDVNGHSCDNRGKNGYCLWVTPQDILTQEEYDNEVKSKEQISQYKELDKLDL